MKTAVLTDSNSGITQAEAKELGIEVVPMPVLINGEEYFEDLTLTQEQFYEFLKDNDTNVSTSQPNPEKVGEYWDRALETHDAVIYIPMSSGLSQTCDTLLHYAASEERFRGKVYVVDNQRISVTQRQSTYDALKMADEGKDAKEIYDWLMETKMQSSIYIMVTTLKYLRKGGRLTPATAAIGTMLSLKPVLQIQGEKLDTFAKMNRTVKKGKQTMIDAIKSDIATRFPEEEKAGKLSISVAYTEDREAALEFKKEVEEAFPRFGVDFVDPLSLSVSCHIGPGALAVTVSIKY